MPDAGWPRVCGRRLAALACLGLAASPSYASAQSGESAPVIRAIRITQPVTVDGRLDEDVYSELPPITGFVQQMPIPGAPGTELTEAWVLFDDTNIYIACRCWTDRPDRIVANDMRRDSINGTWHDHFGVGFDTLYDGRNGYQFQVSAAGGMRDALITDERFSADWNGVWDGRAGRFDGGWTAEMVIPFRTLRYASGTEQIWRIQFRRHIAGKSEWLHLTALNPNWGVSGWNRFASAATLLGLEAPGAAVNLEMKPYVTSRLTTDRLARPAVENDYQPDWGFDVKYGVTRSLTAELTYNTDFAQVEADEAQVNLTRFSLIFPEKREFFLEGQGIFQFGAGGGGDVGGNMVPTILYSRRIGLSGSRAVPVIGGGRLHGKAGAWSIGALSMETDDDADAGVRQTNFTVLRLRRDIFARSTVGGLYTRRSVASVADGANDVWGVDANFAFFTNVYLSGYLAQSKTTGRSGDDLSYRAQFSYTHDRYGLAIDRLVVEPNFNPEIGLIRRQDFRRNLVSARFSPRTTNHRFIRKWTYEGSIDYITDNRNVLESREAAVEVRVDAHNSDAYAVRYQRQYELLTDPFQISRSVQIPAGQYHFDNLTLTYSAGAQHLVSGAVELGAGRFYDGTRKTASFRGRVGVTPQIGVDPTISFNWVDLPWGAFTDVILGSRATYTMTPRMFVAALIQYSSSNASVSTNLRFRWEYQPGSELFVVYTEGRSTLPERGTELENRGFVIKVNRLIRF